MTIFNSRRSLRQTTVWWLFAVLATLSNLAWGAAGYVHEVSGGVSMQAGSAAATSVKAGDTFDPGATFRTAGDGKAVIKFEDGQIVSLQPNTAFRVDGYSFNVNNPKAGSSAMRLLQGAMRYVTGVIGSTNRNNVRLAAGTATIGIRGTDVSVLMDQTTQAVLAMIAAGAVVLETPGGTSAIGVGQYASYVQGQVPTSAAPIASAPPSAQAIVNALRAAPIPVNTPVIVASAAVAAKAVAEARSAQTAAAANPANADLQAAATKAAADANAAIQTAVTQAQAALTTAINNGAVTPTPPAPPTPGAPTPAPAPAPAPPTLQQVNTIINPPVTPPPVKCTGSPC